ncbi:hypothetical protein F5883DRAFT_533172, partial [Diaporthe sp. PMI_573]
MRCVDHAQPPLSVYVLWLLRRQICACLLRALVRLMICLLSSALFLRPVSGDPLGAVRRMIKAWWVQLLAPTLACLLRTVDILLKSRHVYYRAHVRPGPTRLRVFLRIYHFGRFHLNFAGPLGSVVCTRLGFIHYVKPKTLGRSHGSSLNLGIEAESVLWFQLLKRATWACSIPLLCHQSLLCPMPFL